MTEPDHYVGWPLSDRLQLLAFEAELAHLPRSPIAAVWVSDRHPGGSRRPCWEDFPAFAIVQFKQASPRNQYQRTGRSLNHCLTPR